MKITSISVCNHSLAVRKTPIPNSFRTNRAIFQLHQIHRTTVRIGTLHALLPSKRAIGRGKTVPGNLVTAVNFQVICGIRATWESSAEYDFRDFFSAQQLKAPI